jgi:hypothetical protein
MIAAVVWLIVVSVYSAGTLAGWWGMFTKAGYPGWAAVVPGYNLYVLVCIAGIPWGWVFLFLVPLVNFGFWIVVCDQLAIKFGKGIGHTLGLTWLGFVFCPLLGFGPAVYEGAETRPEPPDEDRLRVPRKRRVEEDEPARPRKSSRREIQEAPPPRPRRRREADDY